MQIFQRGFIPCLVALLGPGFSRMLRMAVVADRAQLSLRHTLCENPCTYFLDDLFLRIGTPPERVGLVTSSSTAGEEFES